MTFKVSFCYQVSVFPERNVNTGILIFCFSVFSGGFFTDF